MNGKRGANRVSYGSEVRFIVLTSFPPLSLATCMYFFLSPIYFLFILNISLYINLP